MSRSPTHRTSPSDHKVLGVYVGFEIPTPSGGYNSSLVSDVSTLWVSEPSEPISKAFTDALHGSVIHAVLVAGSTYTPPMLGHIRLASLLKLIFFPAVPSLSEWTSDRPRDGDCVIASSLDGVAESCQPTAQAPQTPRSL